MLTKYINRKLMRCTEYLEIIRLTNTCYECKIVVHKFASLVLVLDSIYLINQKNRLVIKTTKQVLHLVKDHDLHSNLHK